MAYCSQNDILTRISQEELAQLTSDSGDLPDALVVEEAIAQADAEIDSYLGSCCSVPLTPAPPRLKALSADMAIYHIYSRRGVAPPVRRERYEAAVAFLKAVAAGAATLGESAGNTREVEDFSSAARIFSRTGLKDW